MDPKSNGRISGLSLGYIIITNSIGAIIAVVVFLIIQPGTYCVYVSMINDKNP